MAEKSLQKQTSLTQFGVGRLRPGTVQVTVGNEVSLKDLQALIERIVDLNGCRTCGLNGIDIHLRQIDPVIFDRFADIEAVRDVTLIR